MVEDASGGMIFVLELPVRADTTEVMANESPATLETTPEGIHLAIFNARFSTYSEAKLTPFRIEFFRGAELVNTAMARPGYCEHFCLDTTCPDPFHLTLERLMIGQSDFGENDFITIGCGTADGGEVYYHPD